MNKSKYIAMAAATAMVLTMAGCGSSAGSAVEVTPTPMATPTPTAVPVTVTPLPTSTPAPKMIGTKTAQAKFIYLTNNLQSDIRELYLRMAGDEEGDWGKNLISSESAFKSAEQVQMYYGEDSSTGSATASEGDSTASQSTSATKYDVKLVTSDGNSYEIYSVNFGDMEKAALLIDQNTSSVYLRYMSLSSKKETDTRENSQETTTDESDDSSSSDNNSSSSNSSSSNSSSSNNSSSDEETDYEWNRWSLDNQPDTGDDDDDSYIPAHPTYDDDDDDSYIPAHPTYDDDDSYDNNDGYVDEGSDEYDYDTDDSSSSDWDY